MPTQRDDQTRTGGGPAQTGRRTPKDAAKRVGSGIGTVGGSYVRDDRRFGFDDEGMHIPTGNSEILLTRRQLLYGAAGIAGIAAVGGLATTVRNASEEASTAVSLSVPEDDVFTLEDCSEVNADDVMSLAGEYQLPYGSLVWAGNDAVAACLLPSKKATPLVTAALLNLATGTRTTVLKSADGSDDGFEIYDIRASESGVIWTEANILTGAWRVYVAPVSAMELGEHSQVDEGDSTFEMPTLAAVGDRAYWQAIPAETDDDDSDAEVETAVKAVAFASPGQPQTIYTAQGRCLCALSPDNNGPGVVVVASDPDSTANYQLLAVGSDGAVTDSLTLPARMTPMEACHGATGFAFSFDSIYNYGGGIANLGTYTPQAKPDDGQYSNRSWFRFERTPTMPPAWCDGWFAVKSTSAVVACDLASKRYAVFDTDNNAESYGDCLASIGSNATIVLFTNIDRTEAVADDEEATDDDKYCQVRVYTTAENAGSLDASSDESGESDDYTDEYAYDDGSDVDYSEDYV